LLNGKYIDFWMELSSSFAEKKFVIERALEKQNSKTLFYKCNMQNEYLQSVLSNYERKNRYQQRVNEDNKIMKLTEIMHTIRTLLTGIEGRALLLANDGLSQEEKAKSAKILISNMNSLKDFLDQEDAFLDERKVYQSKIQISTISKIITRIQKKISFEAEQKGVVLETKINNPKQSIVGRGEDFIYVIESIISDYIRIIQPNSILYLFVRPMESAPLVEFVLETDLENLSKDTLLAAFSKGNTSRRILDSIGAQFEFSQGKHRQGIKFYLPRLG
jgi:nitrogen-specific signal transduction histidine kinase